jgi:hypothetical protein
VTARRNVDAVAVCAAAPSETLVAAQFVAKGQTRHRRMSDGERVL